MYSSLPPKSIKSNTKTLSLLLQSYSSDSQMVQNYIRPPLTSLQCGALLQSITSFKSAQQGKQLHAYMLSSGILLNNTYLYTRLCALYAICGIMIDARFIFDRIVLRNSFLWNIMIRGYACCNEPSINSLILYREMVYFGKKADNYTYPFVLKACGDLSLVEIGRKIHCEIVVCGFISDTYVGNSLIAMYVKFEDLASAWKLFDKMPIRDVASWNTMISGFASNGQPSKGLLLFHRMLKNGVKPDSRSFVCVLPAIADAGAAKHGKEIHGYILRNNVDFDGFVRNALINVHCSCYFIKGARQLFEDTDNRDAVSWNSMISGYSQCGDALESLVLFCQMNLESVVPDKFTLTAVLGACGQITALQFGKSVHAHAAKNGFVVDVIVGTALVDMYAKCGSLDCSFQVFNEMPEKNLVSWSAMAAGYGLHGRGKEAIAILSEMEEKGIKPDDVTFTSVLSACSHAGLVDEGWLIFNKLQSQYSIKPRVEHYSCMVDLLGRAGHLDDAYGLIKKMPVRPSVDIWAALLSACRVHRNVRLAEIAAQNAFLLKPKRVGLYISLSNIYAADKRWDDVERVRAMVRQKGLKKPPGCSFIELDAQIHRFIVGDKMHPQSSLIYAELKGLCQRLKEVGYIPDTSSVFYDVEDDLKEMMLWDHSERLAIAFALLNTSPGMTIRIAKNLRVCVDCHTVTKLISRIVRREIVVRDAHRFHHFRDGSCSCGDYW